MKHLTGRLLSNYSQSTLLWRNASTLLTGAVLTGFFGLGYAILSELIEFKEGYYVMLAQAMLYFAFPLLFLLGLSLGFIGNLYILIGLTSEVIIVWFTGGLYSPVIPWLGSVPMAALLLVNKRSAWVWCIITLICVIAYGFLALENYQFPLNYNQEYRDIFFVFCYTGLALIIFVIAVIFEFQKSKAQETSDKLLVNILPKETAEELKAHGKSEARLYHSVTVLFADIVDFTRHTEKLNPRELVAELDYCYKKFDEIVTKNNVEKIKVIGDAYMCAGGLPTPNNSHVHDVVKSAIEIQSFMKIYRKKRIEEKRDYFDLRIGIHTGQVVAGIVGTKKFTYDIWGDTVNIASRLESSSISGKINISQVTYNKVKDIFKCTYRGEVEAKNKGKMKMYFVEG